jgi:hypothetical protein
MVQLEILVSSVLFGFICNFALTIDRDYMHEHAFFNYWLFIDSLLMLLFHGYVYLTEYL